MSVYISFNLEVSGIDPKYIEAVGNAAKDHAPVELDSELAWQEGTCLSLGGEGSTSYTSLGADQLAKELVPPIIVANGGKPCKVEATIIWIEHAPTDSYILTALDDE